MVQKLFISVLLAIPAILLAALPARAEVVWFRAPEPGDYYSGTTINKGYCYPISLTENLSTKVNGQVGPGCDFSIDVVAQGEWATAGNYFGTPPYAWVNDSYSGVEVKKRTSDSVRKPEFSYTCDLPAYTLNESALPSYIDLIDTQIIPGSATGPQGKRYMFNLNAQAPANTSFNLDFAFQTNCTMKQRASDWSGSMVPIVENPDYPNACGRSNVVEANPRGTTLKFPVMISAVSCQGVQPTTTSFPASPTPKKPPSCGDKCEPSDNQCPQDCPACVPSGGINRCVASSPSPTPPPSCGEGCDPENNQCPINCAQCISVGGTNRCVASSPSPTPPPSCGEGCDPENNQCPINCAQCIPVDGVNRCVAPSPTPPPSCGDRCNPSDNQCPTNCPNCIPVGGTNRCVAPSLTPTITPQPSPTSVPCNGPCTNSQECALECSQCVNDGSGVSVCKAGCGTPCTSSNQCPQDCAVCSVDGICAVPSPTPTRTPTPTPTPVPCNGPCTDSQQCALECSQCSVNAAGLSVCQTPCGAPCTNSNQCPLDCAACAPATNGSNVVCRKVASCNCDGFTYDGTIGRGERVTFTTYAKVENPTINDAQVLNMIYHVEQNGVEIANSGYIAASQPVNTTDQKGKPIDRYSTNWQYTIPTTDSGNVEYRVYAKINCGYKQPAQAAVQSPNSAQNFQAAVQLENRVLATQDVKPQRLSLLQSIINIFKSILVVFTGVGPTPTPPPISIDYSQYTFSDTQPAYYHQYAVPTISSMDTIKLGTIKLNPTLAPQVELSCKQVRFSFR